MSPRARLVQGGVALSGVVYAFTGAALLFAPRWFFEELGDFPPYNRHYSGDAGSFLLPLGLALLLAAARPSAHRLFLGFAAVASVVHAGNHVYDLAVGRESVADLIPVIVSALVLVLAFAALPRAGSIASGGDALQDSRPDRPSRL